MTSSKAFRIAAAAAAAFATFSLPAHAANESAAAKDRTQLTTASPSTYMENAAERCNPLPAGYKEACLDRVRGAGMREGSVEGGGILRESETTSELGSHMNLPADATNQTVHAPRIVEAHKPAAKAKKSAKKPMAKKSAKKAMKKPAAKHSAVKKQSAAMTTTTTTTTTTATAPAPAASHPSLGNRVVQGAKSAASAVKGAAKNTAAAVRNAASK